MTTAKVIVNAAEREQVAKNQIVDNKYIGKFRSGFESDGVSQKIFTSGQVYYYLVSIDEFPISLAHFKELKSNIRFTKGQYTIQYIPAGSYKRNPKFPYLIGQDLVRIRVTVSGPRHWGAMCDRIPELGWIKRNSTLTDEMFAIAKKHPGLVLRFGIDFVKYCTKIENRANELGIDIDHKPLVVYQWGADSIPHEEEILTIKTKKDYASVLEELQSSSKGEE